jgi:hypothetical protein
MSSASATRKPPLTMCLIALIIFLVSVHSIAQALLTLGNPLASEFPGGVSLSSFGAYKATYNQPTLPYATQSPLRGKPAPSDAELTTRYEALRADRLAYNPDDAKRTLALIGFMLVIAVVLFVAHWRWLRRLTHVEVKEPA